MTASRGAARPARQKRRERIIDVAVQMFSAMEYEDVSIDELCRIAGVAKGLVFYYFTDKRGLFAAAVEQVWDELVEFQAPRPDEDSATARVHGYLRRHFEYANKYPQRFSILMTTGHSNPDVRDIVLRARAQAGSGVVASLGCPTNPPARLRQATVAWAQFVDSVALDWIVRRDTSIDDVVDLCVQTLVAAVRSAKGQPLDTEAEIEALSQVSSEPRPRNPKRQTRAVAAARRRSSAS